MSTISSSLPPASAGSAFLTHTTSTGAGATAEARITLKAALDTVPSCESRDIHDDRIFLTTNESLQERTLGTLKRQPIKGNTIIGVSGFFTLNAASVRGIDSTDSTADIDTIIIVDRAPRVELFWEKAKDIILSSNSAAETAGRIEELIATQADRLFANCAHPPALYAKIYIEKLREEIRSGQSWLSTDAQFAKIKRIFRKDHFIFKRMDLLEPESFHRLARVLADQRCTVDTLYISNISEYVMRSPALLEDLSRSVDHLATPDTLIVHTRPRPCVRCFALEQCVKRTNGAAARGLFEVPAEKVDICGGSRYFATPENTSHRKP